MSAILKCQQFESSRSNKIEPKGWKYQCLDIRDNEEEQGLDKYKGKNERKDIEYISLLFIALFLLLQKESNYLTNMSKVIRSPNHLVYILKIG